MFVLVVDGLACKSVHRLKRTNNDAYTRTPHSLYAACIGQSHLTHTGWDNREFKIYDATVAKTSFKIASSSFSIYFAIMSVCLTFES